MPHTFDERFVFSPDTVGQLIYDEHLVRYQFATQFATGKRVLDCASGSGYGAKLLKEAGALSVIGIDLDELALTQASQDYGGEGISFSLDDAQGLHSLADASIDLITSFETIEHLTDFHAYLIALKRVLAPNGLALISTPNKAIWGQKNPFHVHEFERSEFESELGRYFAQVKLLDQYNGLASIIGGLETTTSLTSTGEPQYFLALCGESLPEAYIGRASINGEALARWQANPGWKLVNKLYTVLVKVGVIRR